MWETSEPLPAMGPRLLCLLLVSVLSTYVFINFVNVTIWPRERVESGTDVRLECRTGIVVMQGHSPSVGRPAPKRRQYVLLKNDEEVNSSESEADQQTFSIPRARVADSGNYHCRVKAHGRSKSSAEQQLTVQGLQTPTLVLDTYSTVEGKEVLANCSAPLEHGTFFFSFYENSKEVKRLRSATGTAAAKLTPRYGLQKWLYCRYTVILWSDSVLSNPSNNVTLDVYELFVTPSISVWPANDVVEGDRFAISCTIKTHQQNPFLILTQEAENVVAVGKGTVEFNVTANTTHSGVYTCKANMNDVEKHANTTMSVAELFSKPVLSVHPPEVFENESFAVTCYSSNVTPHRIQRGDLQYSLYRDGRVVSRSDTYSATAAPALNGRYGCKARAGNIWKESTEFVLKAKELVSQPLIKAVGEVILHRAFEIQCSSARGHLPVHYILMKGRTPVRNVTVNEPNYRATFMVSVHNVSEIRSFACQAENNGPSSRVLGRRLNASVIVPVSTPELKVPPDIVEGNNLTLVCRIDSGSPPVTFEWYLQGSKMPLSTNTVEARSSKLLQESPAWDLRDFQPLYAEHQVKKVKMEDAGDYYCRALNDAGDATSSFVNVKVELAHWKKGLIAAFCLLLVAAIVIGAIVWFKNKRGRRHMATELSVKPSSPKSDDSLTASLAYDTEVYNAHKDAEPQCDGTEGRATNGMRDSMASFPANGSNRSSCSSPATV
ncbi:platelet endothelial cell adhesion molecule-like isoform X2 [Scleropages formosus]|uniref:platelet endothelial cell adhesion molecule-like isoform X2 n=1 Tax=Scleropages formosus TaxID=113540 RepID=UPI00087854D5|nr:platelet endothelial cell adhesion molecule-like isoform X2 [Scleropages formosus]